ncbi:MAG: hypothetical protein KAH16_05110 [Candidatus Izimaplasma sp.]|nr:hypothetical protein [Candidatus Izimaplasma bacterium]
MTKCKLCNKNLFERISFSNIFNTNYSVHTSCTDSLVINKDRIAFPFYENIIYYDYLFYAVNSAYNIDYIEQKYLSILYIRNLDNIDWSIIIFYETGLFRHFCDSDLDILFSLANKPCLVISILYYDMSNVFNEE